VRSDPSATPEVENRPVTRPATKAVVVPLASPPDVPTLFYSETKSDKPDAFAENASDVALRVPLFPAERTPAARQELPLPSVAAPRSRARNAVIALLSVAALAQAGFIAFWMLPATVVATPPDTGSLSVTSEPSGLPVTIDGTPRGETPVKVTLAPGSHRIDVGNGSLVRSQHVSVARGGDVSVHMGLGPAAAGVAGTGALQVATEPSGARVWIDGELRGASPLTVPNLKAGQHAVTVQTASGEPVSRTVTVEEATVASLVISMNLTSGFASGWLAITSGVPLQIFEKGTLIGTTDTPRILLPAGAHELEMVNADLGYKVARKVQITAGQTAAFGLTPPTGTLSVNALPWAEVWIDGKRAGETPIGNFSIAIGRHELLFKHPELGEQRKTVTVGLTSPLRVSADMRKP
jgi:hypothetical protein